MLFRSTGRLQDVILTPENIHFSLIEMVDTGDEAWYASVDNPFYDTASLYRSSTGAYRVGLGSEEPTKIMRSGASTIDSMFVHGDLLYRMEGGNLIASRASGAESRTLYAATTGSSVAALTDDMIYLLLANYGAGGLYAEAESYSLCGIPYDFEIGRAHV